MNNVNTSVVNGANPDMIWGQFSDYLLNRANTMKREYMKRMKGNQHFTWDVIDNISNLIRSDLDTIIQGANGLRKNNQLNCNRNMNGNAKNVVRLTEPKLRNMIKESVRQALREKTETVNTQNSDTLLKQVINFAKNILGNLFTDIVQKPGYMAIGHDCNTAYGLIIGLDNRDSKTLLKIANKFCSEVESKFNVGTRIVNDDIQIEIAIWDKSTIERMEDNYSTY